MQAHGTLQLFNEQKIDLRFGSRCSLCLHLSSTQLPTFYPINLVSNPDPFPAAEARSLPSSS